MDERPPILLPTTCGSKIISCRQLPKLPLKEHVRSALWSATFVARFIRSESAIFKIVRSVVTLFSQGAIHWMSSKRRLLIIGHVQESRSCPACARAGTVLDDQRTRAAMGNACVKIYNAQSAAAIIALFVGRYREMAADTAIGLHLPLLTVDPFSVDADNHLTGCSLESCRTTVELVEGVMRRCGLDEPELKSELHQSGWLRLAAAECSKRGLVNRLFRHSRLTLPRMPPSWRLRTNATGAHGASKSLPKMLRKPSTENLINGPTRAFMVMRLTHEEDPSRPHR